MLGDSLLRPLDYRLKLPLCLRRQGLGTVSLQNPLHLLVGPLTQALFSFRYPAVVSLPIYKLRDGRYLLLYYNNDGSANGGEIPAHYSYVRQNRYPAFITVGRERLGDPVQPIHFGRTKMFATSDGVPLGAGGRTEVATYPSLLEDEGERILFYPDRKCFLLGRYITDAWLADCDPGA